MAARNVKLALTHNAGGAIVLDGKDISDGVRSVQMYSKPGGALVLELEVIAEPIVPEKCRAALVALGWTPPADA